MNTVDLVNRPNLRPCEDCGQLVSLRASSCPGCGAPINVILTGPKNISPPLIASNNETKCCPSCASFDVRRFSVLYENGTSHGQFSGAGVGLGGGGLGVGAFGGSTTSQTMLAMRVQPPGKPMFAPVALLVIIALGLVITAVAAWQIQKLTWGFGAFTAGMVAFAAFGWFMYLGRKQEFPRLRAKWDQSWMCVRCGRDF